jgi:hypothetical protein
MSPADLTDRTRKALRLAPLLCIVGLAACSSMGGPGACDTEGYLCGYQADKNNDGQISREEWNDAYTAHDTDGDGSLSTGEARGGR